MRAGVGLAGLLVLTGCGDPVHDEFVDRAELPSCGSIDAGLDRSWRSMDPEAWDCFADALARGTDAELQVTYSTDEGDPIPTWYRLHDGAMTIYEDTTKDAFGAGRWVVTRCDPPEEIGREIGCG